MYVVYDPQGMIVATIGGPDETYGPEILDKEGKLWLFDPEAAAVDIRFNHVDVASKKLTPNRAIELVASKAAIAADSVDVSIISGIPNGAAVTVLCNGVPILGDIVDDGQVEFTAAAAGAYRFLVSCAKYNAAELEVSAS